MIARVHVFRRREPRTIAAVGILVMMPLAPLLACEGRLRPSDAPPSDSDAGVVDGTAAPRCTFSTSRPTIEPGRVGGLCSIDGADCPFGERCVQLREFDIGDAEPRTTGRCVKGKDCEGFLCPPCHSCGINLMVGASPSCSLDPEAWPAVKAPELLEQPCRTKADCAEGRVCLDARAVDDRQREPRCTKEREWMCGIVECGAYKRCVSSDDGNVVRLTCVPAE